MKKQKTQNLKKLLNTNKGITIIALMVTIIVMLILASFTITFVINDDGLFESAKNAVNMQELVQIQQELEMAKMTLKVNNELVFERYLQYLIEQQIINQEDIIRDKENPNHIVDILIEGYRFTVTDINADGTNLNNIKITYVGLESNLQPTIELTIVNTTTGTIEVKAKSKNANNEKYEYYIKKASEDDNSFIKDGDATESITHTFYKLTQNEEYTVKVVMKMKGKNDAVDEASAITVELEDIQEGDIIFELSEEEWTNGNVTVKAIINNDKFKNYSIQTSLNSVKWDDTDTQIATASSDIIYAKIVDGQGNETAITGCSDFKIDKTNPNIVTALTSKNITDSGFTLDIEIADTESGLSKIIWYYKMSKESSYTKIEETLNTTTATMSKNFSDLINEAYDAYVVVYDVVGNKVTTDVLTTKLSIVEVGDISGSYTGDIDCTKLENYNELTKDNFFFESETIDVPGCYGEMTFTKSYNSSTGVLTINRSSIIRARSDCYFYRKDI